MVLASNGGSVSTFGGGGTSFSLVVQFSRMPSTLLNYMEFLVIPGEIST